MLATSERDRPCSARSAPFVVRAAHDQGVTLLGAGDPFGELAFEGALRAQHRDHGPADRHRDAGRDGDGGASDHDIRPPLSLRRGSLGRALSWPYQT